MLRSWYFRHQRQKHFYSALLQAMAEPISLLSPLMVRRRTLRHRMLRVIAFAMAVIATQAGAAGAADAPGYSVLTKPGGIYSFGSAQYYGNLIDHGYPGPAVGLATTPGDRGYSILTGFGGVYTFGDARYFGNLIDHGYPGPAVGIAMTPTGAGYAVLTSFGGIYTFGDARYWGNLIDHRYPGTAVAISYTPSGGGYAVLTATGGLYTFGDARYWGNLLDHNYPGPGASLSYTPTGNGYHILNAKGAVYTFGDAGYFGNLLDHCYPGPGVGLSNTLGPPVQPPPANGDCRPPRVIPVPWRAATHPLSCEAASLQMLLAYYGKPQTQDDVMAFVGQDLRPPYWDGSGRMHWGDPYTTFVGSVNGSEQNYTGYGMKFPPLANAATHFNLPVIRAGDGISPADLYAAVQAGHPAEVWGSYDYVPHNGVNYTAFDGRPIFWGRFFEHVFVVTAINQDQVGILDPFRNSNIIYINKPQFEAQWAEFDNAGVIFG